MLPRRLACGALGLAGVSCSLLTDLDALERDAGDAALVVDAGWDGPMKDASSAEADAFAATCAPTKAFGAPQLIDELETSWDDHAPRLLPNGLYGFFSSNRNGGAGGFDLYFIYRADAGAPFQVAPVTSLNKPANEESPTATADGQTLYYSISTSGAAMDLRVAYFADGGYGNVASLSATNSGANDIWPYVRPDGTVLYFSSNRAQSYDLFYARINGGGAGAGVAVNELNTSADEIAPVISADELTIWFARSVTARGYDVFMATRASVTTQFGVPTPVAELNTSYNDVPGFITADGCTLYFMSDRTGGYGNYDIYVSKR